MRRFAQLFREIDQTTETNVIHMALVSYFKEADECDHLAALALLWDKRPKRSVASAQLRSWAIEETGLPVWLFEESYQMVNDLAETIAHFVPNPDQQDERGLRVIVEEISLLVQKSNDEKQAWVQQMWKGMQAYERFIIHKLVTGSAPFKVPKKLLVDALAEVSQEESSVVFHALSGEWGLETESLQHVLETASASSNSAKPYPFRTIDEVEENISTLGKPVNWIAEWQLDGIRCQIIKRDGVFFIWDKNEELITEKFPELQSLSDVLPEGISIEGIIVAWKAGKILPDAKLKSRFKRKNVSKKLLTEIPVHVIAYDQLEEKGQDIRKESLLERKKILSSNLETLNSPALISSTELITFDNWDSLAELHQYARDHQATGLVLKEAKKGYSKGNWFSWPASLLQINAVLLYAHRNQGRGGTAYAEYTFAVWKEDQLVPFTKASEGLGKDDLDDIAAFVKGNTLERFGPVRSVRPELVFTIAFENIQYSSRHKSGLTIQGPVILERKININPEDAGKLSDLEAFLKQYQH
ncbi:MAG: cisplatin damage response ATP-dependent DNA ligase [Bacteroidia bacterium]